jgi:phytoene dehydrogenase-like protein
MFDFGRARGHEPVRDGKVPAASADWPVKAASVVVVGGGVAGLAAAWRLRLAGVDDVLVLELDDAPGGTARSGRSDVTAYPWGAHYVVLPFADNRAFTKLLDEMGVLDGVDERGEPRAKEEHGVREPEERHFRAGSFMEGLYPVEGESPDEKAQRDRFTREMNAMAALVDGSGRRAFTIPRARSSDDASLLALDGKTFAQWLDERRFTSPRLRWLCDYACRDDYGLSADTTSAWAGLFYFCARRRPASELGEVDREVLTWPEGNGRIVAHLAKGVGERVLGEHAVVEEILADRAPGTASVL